jgi:PHD/YefM family antitoxin component YafN of YafNO toxin-antitoxin module
MITLHPEFLNKNGKREFVVLPYEEFAALQEALADAEDLRELRAAKLEEATAPTLSLHEIKTRYGGG